MYMQQGNKTLIWVAIYGVIGYGVYKYFFSKKRYANIIASSGNFSSGVSVLTTFDAPFLKNWSTAAKNGQPTFMYNGKTYNTKGGKAKTN